METLRCSQAIFDTRPTVQGVVVVSAERFGVSGFFWLSGLTLISACTTLNMFSCHVATCKLCQTARQHAADNAGCCKSATNMLVSDPAPLSRFSLVVILDFAPPLLSLVWVSGHFTFFDSFLQLSWAETSNWSTCSLTHTHCYPG